MLGVGGLCQHLEGIEDKIVLLYVLVIHMGRNAAFVNQFINLSAWLVKELCLGSGSLTNQAVIFCSALKIRIAHKHIESMGRN